MSKKKIIVISCLVLVVVAIATIVLVFVEPGVCLDCHKFMVEEPDYKYSAYGDIYCNDCADNHKNCSQCGKEILVNYDDYCPDCLAISEVE